MAELVVKESSMLISKASSAWKFLHGTINVNKPAEMYTGTVINAIKTNICKDLNSMELDEPKPLVEIESIDNKSYSVELVPNLAEDPLSTGPRYTNEMLRIFPAHILGFHTSGVQLLGINKGVRFAYRLRNRAPIQTFHVTGRFGKATETNFQGDRITNRAGYRHVTKGKLQALVSSKQTAYQKQMYQSSGIDLQSQEAYELACKGLIRPKDTKHTIIYGMRNIEFTGKTFTLEIQSMNASEEKLANLIIDIALELRTVACCSKIRCTRYGYFSFEDSLLRSHWNLQNVLKSMHETQRIVHEHPAMMSEDIATPVGYEDDLDKS